MELGGICRRWVVLRGAGSVCDPASLAGEPISSLDLSKTGGGGGGISTDEPIREQYGAEQ